jgi:transposase
MGDLSQDIIQVLLERIATLEAEVERLRLELAAAKKNSRNSSKPPSSDIVKPPPSGGKSTRRIGGQPGHEPHFRAAFAPEQLDEVHIFNPPSMLCGRCGGELRATPASDQVRQQIDLRPDPLIRREYRAPAYRCAACGTFHREKLPKHAARADFIGDGLAAALAFLNVKAHASYSALASFMEDVCGERLSRGQIAKAFRRVSVALEAPYAEALVSLKDEPVLNIDETGHREKGKRFWTWVFRAEDFAVFHIDKTRAAAVLDGILGPDYQGTIGCDYFSAYHKYIRDNDGQAQFCFAHLIRELRFLADHANSETRRYARRSLAATRRLFRVHHHLRDNPGGDRQALVKAGESLRRTIVRSPPEGKAENIARRFLDNGDSYLRFITNPEIEPTNNRAEQAIRQVVIDRASSQGTRSQNGRDYKERMWTLLATCAMRGASTYHFLRDALNALANKTTPASMLTL